MEKQCVYCGEVMTGQVSREHVISKAVLQVPFGRDIRNVSRSELFNKKFLLDHEQTIKDVCRNCNNILSQYDAAGANLVQSIHDHYDLQNVTIALDDHKIGWIIKTHLNYLRMIPDKETGECYSLSSQFYDRLLRGKIPQGSLYKLYVEGWRGLPYFWEENDERKLPYFNYRSVRFTSQRIVVSNFRIKALETFFMFPSNSDYRSFNLRCASVVQEMKNDNGFDLQKIDVGICRKHGYVKVGKTVDTVSLLSIIRKME